MFTWVVKKCLNLTFKVFFLHQKSFKSFWFFFHWRISVLQKVYCCCHFLKTSIFEPICFLKWCPIFDSACEHLWKSNQKILLIFLLKPTSYWLTSAKLHHWGHTNPKYANIFFFFIWNFCFIHTPSHFVHIVWNWQCIQNQSFVLDSPIEMKKFFMVNIFFA